MSAGRNLATCGRAVLDGKGSVSRNLHPLTPTQPKPTVKMRVMRSTSHSERIDDVVRCAVQNMLATSGACSNLISFLWRVRKALCTSVGSVLVADVQIAVPWHLCDMVHRPRVPEFLPFSFGSLRSPTVFNGCSAGEASTFLSAILVHKALQHAVMDTRLATSFFEHLCVGRS